jgi:hypothetical protein
VLAHGSRQAASWLIYNVRQNMSTRRADDAEVQRIVRDFSFPSEEASVREATKNWSSADFVYAIGRLAVAPPRAGDIPKMRELYGALRNERAAEETRLQVERDSVERHAQLTKRLEQLQKPHWSVVPNFVVTVISAVAAIAATVIAWLAFRH